MSQVFLRLVVASCTARICFIAYKPEFSFPVKKKKKNTEGVKILIGKSIILFFNDLTVQHQ